MSQDTPENADYENTAEWREFVEQVRTGLLPKIRESAATIMLKTDTEPDVKQAVELGMSLLLGKPIIIVATPGAEVPAGLKRLAAEVIENFEFGPAGQERLQGAITRTFAKVDAEAKLGSWDDYNPEEIR